MLDATMAEWRPPSEAMPAGGTVWRRRPAACGRLSAGTRGWPRHCRSPVHRRSGRDRWTEWVLDALDGAGSGPATTFDIHLTLFTFVRGTAINLEAEAAATAITGLDADQWMDTQLPTLRAIADQTGHRHFTELVNTPYDFSLDRIFEQGLRYLLNGLAAELDG